MTIFVDSDEFIRVGVSSEQDDVSTGTVSFGLGADKDTPPTTWVNGTWQPDKEICFIDGKYVEAFVARVLSQQLGLSAGNEFIFTRVILGTQTIIKYAGKVVVK